MQYPQASRIMLAIDCCIFGFDGDDLKILLIKRNFEPEAGKWSLMGGFLKENEDLEIAAGRILHELTGLNNVYMEQLKAHGKTDRDPVERTVSICFFALINIHEHDSELARKKNGQWFNIADKPNLIFDHDAMVESALHQIRYKAALHPIGFELLPEKFTIPQLQKLYEAIYDSKLDRRNFSRKILSTKLLISTGEKNENAATNKAMLYKLDSEKYKSQFNAFHYFINL
ncbi:NUDIX hydrolase [Lacihabitans lacunae]|jgi:8-oxo-dGTP diphosphatase|uniref:NUDIX domain-containing protein n=1 Tax=Lacihabitans lacunae TaxID=1028214 RepID=A0ABV7YZ33_9BACT